MNKFSVNAERKYNRRDKEDQMKEDVDLLVIKKQEF